MLISTRVSEKLVKLEPNCSYQYFSNENVNIRTGCGPSTETVVSKSPYRFLAGSMSHIHICCITLCCCLCKDKYSGFFVLVL